MNNASLLERMDLTLAAYRWLSAPEHFELIEASELYKEGHNDLLVELLNNDELRNSEAQYLVWYLSFKAELLHEAQQREEQLNNLYNDFIQSMCEYLYTIEDGTEEELLAGLIRTTVLRHKSTIKNGTKLVDEAVVNFESTDWYSSVGNFNASLIMVLINDYRNDIVDMRSQINSILHLVNLSNEYGQKVFKQTTNKLRIIDSNIAKVTRVYNAAFTMRRVKPIRRRYVSDMMLSADLSLSDQHTNFSVLMNNSKTEIEISNAWWQCFSQVREDSPALNTLPNEIKQTA